MSKKNIFYKLVLWRILLFVAKRLKIIQVDAKMADFGNFLPIKEIAGQPVIFFFLCRFVLYFIICLYFSTVTKRWWSRCSGTSSPASTRQCPTSGDPTPAPALSNLWSVLPPYSCIREGWYRTNIFLIQFLVTKHQKRASFWQLCCIDLCVCCKKFK